MSKWIEAGAHLVNLDHVSMLYCQHVEEDGVEPGDEKYALVARVVGFDKPVKIWTHDNCGDCYAAMETMVVELKLDRVYLDVPEHFKRTVVRSGETAK